MKNPFRMKIRRGTDETPNVMFLAHRIQAVSKITLDAETFKALASSTRLMVLRALDERRKTLSELSRDLELNKATVHEHLQLLAAAELVKKRDDEGRKWIYYELTWRGQRLLHPQETTTFNVLLGMGVAGAGGGFILLGRALGWWLQEKAADLSLMNAPEGASGDGAGTAAAPPSSQTGTNQDAPSVEAARDTSLAPQTDGFWDDGGLALALLACSVLFGYLGWKLRQKVRPKPFVEPREPVPSDERPTGQS